jgi:predicted RecB family nuclease
VVKKKTEWPTNDYSIKTLASYLGFHWRDESPSGVESIEWYHQWVETGDVRIKKEFSSTMKMTVLPPAFY